MPKRSLNQLVGTMKKSIDTSTTWKAFLTNHTQYLSTVDFTTLMPRFSSLPTNAWHPHSDRYRRRYG
jgi:hypothetical protein